MYGCSLKVSYKCGMHQIIFFVSRYTSSRRRWIRFEQCTMTSALYSLDKGQYVVCNLKICQAWLLTFYSDGNDDIQDTTRAK